MVLPTLGMSGEYVAAADVLQHRCGDVARVGTVVVLAAILRAEGELRAELLDQRNQVWKWREHRDVAMRGKVGDDRADQFLRARARAVHLPVSGDQFAAHVWAL